MEFKGLKVLQVLVEKEYKDTFCQDLKHGNDNCPLIVEKFIGGIKIQVLDPQSEIASNYSRDSDDQVKKVIKSLEFKLYRKGLSANQRRITIECIKFYKSCLE